MYQQSVYTQKPHQNFPVVSDPSLDNNSIFVNDLKKKIQMPSNDFAQSFHGLESLKSRFLKNNSTLPQLNNKLKSQSKYSNQFSKTFINDHARSRQNNFSLTQKQTLVSVTPGRLTKTTNNESPGPQKKYEPLPKDFHMKVNEKLMNLALDSISQNYDGQKSPFFRPPSGVQKLQNDDSKSGTLNQGGIDSQTFKSYSIAAQHHSRIKHVPRRKSIESSVLERSRSPEGPPRVSSALRKLEDHKPPPDEYYLQDISLYEV